MRDDILTYAWFHKLACNCCDACLQKLFYGYVSFLQGGHCTQNSPSFNFFLNFVLAQELWQPDASSWIVKDGGGRSQKKQLHPSPSNGLTWSQHWLLCEKRSNCIPDMEFVKNFTHPDFQAKIFTPQKRVNCDIFLANQQRKCIKY